MKNMLLTMALVSLGTLAIAQKAPSAPVAPAAPPMERPTAMPAMYVVPEVPDVPLAEDLTGIDEQSDDGLTKTFSKTFPASAADRINVNNQFGSITIKTWDRKEVKADVSISAYSNNADEQQKLLDGAQVVADKSGDQINFRTEMNTNRNGNWGNGTRNGKKWRREVRVNYVLYVPSTCTLNLLQQYGNVEVGSFAGPVNAKVQYGNFNAQKLSNSNNNLTVQYGKMTVQDLNRANLKQQYGGGIILGSAREINVSAQYSNVNIEKLLGDAAISIQYNNLKIGQVAESARNLSINSQYVRVDVGFSDQYKGRMDVKTSYCDFRFGSGVAAKIEGDGSRSHTSKNYIGEIGGGGSGQVSVKSAYGSVTFR